MAMLDAVAECLLACEVDLTGFPANSRAAFAASDWPMRRAITPMTIAAGTPMR